MLRLGDNVCMCMRTKGAVRKCTRWTKGMAIGAVAQDRAAPGETVLVRLWGPAKTYVQMLVSPR